MQYIMLIAPIIAVLVPYIIREIRRPAQPDEARGRLPVMVVLLLLLTSGGTFLYYLWLLFLSYRTVFHIKAANDVFCMVTLALLAYFVLLLERGLARLLELNKKNRVISKILMLVFWSAEIIVLAMMIAGVL